MVKSLQGPLHNIDGEVTCTVLDNDGMVSTILTANKPWSVKVDWTVNNGALITPNETWRVRLYVESIGPGAERKLAEKDIPVTAPHGSPYTWTFTMPADMSPPPIDLPSTPGADEPSGLYKVVAVITLFFGPAASPSPLPIAGYAETGMIQFMRQ